MLEVGVVERVPGVGQRDPHRVGAVLADRLPERLEVARRLGHLLGVEQQVAVAPHPARPEAALVAVFAAVFFFRAGPDRGVGVDAEGEVVVDEVLAGDAEVLREKRESFFFEFFFFFFLAG